MTQAVEVESLLPRVVAQLDRAVVGKGDALRVVVAALVAGGHVLLEDVPGVGKTLAAKLLARHLGLSFARIQFTPDLLPSDVTGAVFFDQRDREFVFRPGPVFAGLVLADEINRSPAKTQAALLEAMGEGHITVDGVTRDLPSPFRVIATANPVEYEGTFPLPEAQLDRFHVRVALGYPSETDETDMVESMAATGSPTADTSSGPGSPVVVDLAACQSRVSTVHVAREVADYVVSLVRASRKHSALSLGASPRGSLALVRCAQAVALVDGRRFVTPNDVQLLAGPVLAHRLTLRPELWGSRTTTDQVVREIVAATPAPDAMTKR